MSEVELIAIEVRAWAVSNLRLTFAGPEAELIGGIVQDYARDVPVLLAEVRRLRALMADQAPIPEHCPVCGRPRVYECARL